MKLRKRPAWWILVAVLLVAVVLFGYLLSYTLVAGDAEVPGMDREAILEGLLPAELVTTALSQLTAFGGPIALILAVLFVGSEYGWGTLKTLATQRPGRVTLAVGKLAALAIALAGLAAATVVAALLASLLVAALQGEPVVLPALGDLAGGLGAGWLVLAVYAALGVLLAVLFRGTGLALGLGLVYVFVIENLLLTLPLPDWFQETAAQALLTPNALALSRAFGEAAAGPQMIAGAVPGAGRAGAVLAAYVVALCAAGVLVLRQRAIE